MATKTKKKPAIASMADALAAAGVIDKEEVPVPAVDADAYEPDDPCEPDGPDGGDESEDNDDGDDAPRPRPRKAKAKKKSAKEKLKELAREDDYDDDPDGYDDSDGDDEDDGDGEGDGKGSRWDRQVRVGLLFRREPDEVGKMFVSGDRFRSGIMLAYVGEKGTDEPLRWSGSLVQYYPPQWDKRRQCYTAGLRSVEAFRCHCSECEAEYAELLKKEKAGKKGKRRPLKDPGAARAGVFTIDARTAIEAAEHYSGFKRGKGKHAVDAMVALGDVCPACGRQGLDEWHAFDPLGADADEIYTPKVISAFRSSILLAKGDLELPPIVGYVENGDPHSRDGLPNSVALAGLLDKAADKVEEMGLELVDIGGIGVREDGETDEVAGFDLVLSGGTMVGTCRAGDLDSGVKQPRKDDPYQVLLRVPLRAAMDGVPKFLANINAPYEGDYAGRIRGPGSRKDRGGRMRGRRVHV